MAHKKNADAWSVGVLGEAKKRRIPYGCGK
jgi:hypothetical protein